MRYRYHIDLNLKSNSKRECIEELSEIIESLKSKNAINHSYCGGTEKTEVTGYLKKPASRA
jgi:hypothetical protein